MKIREGFVTNSSSTNYIVSVKRSNLEKLLNVIKNCPMDSDGEDFYLRGIYINIEEFEFALPHLSNAPEDNTLVKKSERAFQEGGVLVCYTIPHVFERYFEEDNIYKDTEKAIKRLSTVISSTIV